MNSESYREGLDPQNKASSTWAEVGGGPTQAARGERTNWRCWMRLFLMGNPFYVLSAVLLLYGIGRLSGNEHFLTMELDKLLFNFGALEGYEVLLAGTAIGLFRRPIMYDSGLLVVLEQLLVFVPFLLVSQAIFLGGGLAGIFCLGAVILAAGRMWGLRRYCRSLVLPRALWVMGVMTLVAQAVIPMFFRGMYVENDAELRHYYIETALGGCWHGWLPVVLGLLLVLPRDSAETDGHFSRRWVFLVIGGLWTLVSGAHFAAIGYVYDVPWRWEYVLTALWAGAWLVYVRRTDFMAEVSPRWEAVVLPIPLILSFIQTSSAEGPERWLPGVVNAVGYGILLGARPGSRLISELVLWAWAGLIGQGVMVLTAAGWFGASGIPFLAIVFLVFVLLHAAISSDPRWGLAGMAVCILALMHWVNWPGMREVLAIQTGCLFLLLHSLRWDDRRQAGAIVCRWLAAGVWVLSSSGELAVGVSSAGGMISLGAAIVVLMVTGLCWWWDGKRPPMALLVAGVTVPMLAPLNLVWRVVHQAPGGVWALIGSLGLFVVGTGIALIRPRLGTQVFEEDRREGEVMKNSGRPV